MGGECSHHCAIPATPEGFGLLSSFSSLSVLGVLKVFVSKKNRWKEERGCMGGEFRKDEGLNVCADSTCRKKKIGLKDSLKKLLKSERVDPGSFATCKWKLPTEIVM